jgi:hypothetical protein
MPQTMFYLDKNFEMQFIEEIHMTWEMKKEDITRPKSITDFKSFYHLNAEQDSFLGLVYSDPKSGRIFKLEGLLQTNEELKYDKMKDSFHNTEIEIPYKDIHVLKFTF